MIEIIKNLIGTLISTGVVTAVIILVSRKCIELWFSKDLEKFKAELEKQSVAFNIKFQSLHTERAVIIKDLYQMLVKTDKDIVSLINPIHFPEDKPLKERAEQARHSINGLIEYYERNKIFLNDVIEERMDKLLKLCRDTWLEFDFARYMKEQQEPGYAKKWSETWRSYERESSRLKEEIIKEFRKIISIEE
jgi:hypothetical protein